MTGGNAERRPGEGRAALVISVVVLTALAAPLVLMPIAVMVSAMAFDAPGAFTAVRPYLLIVAVFAYPAAWTAAVLGTWWLRRRRRYAQSLLLTLLPLLAVSPLCVILWSTRREPSGPVKARDLYVDGTRAWVTASTESDRRGWLATVDLANPCTPKEEHAVPLTHPGTTVTGSGLASWAILGLSEGAALLADPGEDIRVVDLESGQTLARPAEHITGGALRGRCLFVAAWRGLTVYDVAQPSAARAVASAALRADAVAAVSDSRGLVVVAPLGTARSELRVFDVDEQAQLRQRGSWLYPARTRHVALAVVGDRAAVLVSDRTLRLIDFTDPDRPAEVGRLTLPADARRLAARGRIAAIAGLDPRSVWLVDLSDPAHPVIVGGLGPFDAEPALAFAGDRLLVAAGRVLTATDVSDPAAPRECGRVDLRGEPLPADPVGRMATE
jgi:hypothetical protein